MNDYIKYIELIENNINELMILDNAIKQVSFKKIGLDSIEAFSDAVSNIAGFEFNAKSYGIKNIQGIINKNKRNMAMIAYDIYNSIEYTITDQIYKSSNKLKINPVVKELIYDYNFNDNHEDYTRTEYDGLIYLIKNEMSEEFIIDYCLKIMNIKETRRLNERLIAYHSLLINNISRNDNSDEEDIPF